MTNQQPPTSPSPSTEFTLVTTLETFDACLADPEAILALFLDNQQKQEEDKTAGESGKQRSWRPFGSLVKNENSEEGEDDDKNKKIREQRRWRIIAWFSFFFTNDDQIWEREEFEKLDEKVDEAQAEQQQDQDQDQGDGVDELSDTNRERDLDHKDDNEKKVPVVDQADSSESDDDSDDDEEEQECCRKRMMLRQEIFADWKAGRHPFFYDDEDMPESPWEEEDRIYKMSLIFKCPKWQDCLESAVKGKMFWKEM